MTFGEKLQQLRKSRGLTQEQLAEKIGVTRQALSRWEAGAALPDTENVLRLSDLFGVTTDYLLRDGIEQPEPPNGAQASAEEKPSRLPGLVGAALAAVSALGLLALGIAASVGDYEVWGSGRQPKYTGFPAFLEAKNLWWLAALLALVLFFSVVLTADWYKGQKK